VSLVSRPPVPITSVLGRSLRFAGATATVLAVPASLFWLPVATIPGLGRVTLSDLNLLSLWMVAALHILSRRSADPQRRLPMRMVGFSVLLAVLAAFGAFTSEWPSSPAFEFGLQMKRFGLAGVLPLSMYLFDSNATRKALLLSLTLCTIAMLVFAISPDLREKYLAVATQNEGFQAPADRMSGLVSNPNDAAYVAVCLGTIVGTLIYARRAVGILRSLSFAGLFAMAIGAVVLSGSRSGAIGLMVGVLFLAFRGGWPRRARIGILLFVGVTLVALGRTNDVFQDRFRAAYTHGPSEENFAGRVQAQWIVTMAATENPLGIGYKHFPEVTRKFCEGTTLSVVNGSDSIYFDTLLGTGFLGLLVLLGLYRDCWRYSRQIRGASGRSVALVQAGLVALSVFGFATVSPMSVFVAPVAFSLVGCAIYVRPGERAAAGRSP